ncbi:MAG: hypothetical protein ACRD3J_03885, partial [Thermoanaerobaculia bacterium]
MNIAVALAVSVLPVFLFLVALVLLDSYKLIPLRAILVAVAAGAVAAVVAFAINVALERATGLGIVHYTIYVGPVLEEVLKAVYVIWLLRRNKVGFVVDAATYGFA